MPSLYHHFDSFDDFHIHQMSDKLSNASQILILKILRIIFRCILSHIFISHIQTGQEENVHLQQKINFVRKVTKNVLWSKELIKNSINKHLGVSATAEQVLKHFRQLLIDLGVIITQINMKANETHLSESEKIATAAISKSSFKNQIFPSFEMMGLLLKTRNHLSLHYNTL